MKKLEFVPIEERLKREFIMLWILRIIAIIFLALTCYFFYFLHDFYILMMSDNELEAGAGVAAVLVIIFGGLGGSIITGLSFISSITGLKLSHAFHRKKFSCLTNEKQIKKFKIYKIVDLCLFITSITITIPIIVFYLLFYINLVF